MSGAAPAGAPGKRTHTSGLEGPSGHRAAAKRPNAGGLEGPEDKKGVKRLSREGEGHRGREHEVGFDNKQDVYDPKKVPKAVKKGASIGAEVLVPDATLAEGDTGEQSGMVDERLQGSKDFGDKDGVHGTAEGKLLEGTASADGHIKLEDGDLKISGNAGARVTLATGSATVTIPDKTFTLFGETVGARFEFDVAADAFAGGDASVKADVGVTGGGIAAKLSGFAGAKAIASGTGELRWHRKPTEEYARRIARNDLFMRTAAPVIPDIFEPAVAAAVQPFVEIILDKILSGAESQPLVLGVTATAEGSAGVGASAGFSAGMRDGVLYCKGNAGLTLGLGGGYQANLALGIRDGTGMVGIMALSGAGLLGDDLQPERSWTDVITSTIRNYLAGRTLFSWAREWGGKETERKLGDAEGGGVHGKIVTRRNGLKIYADGHAELDEGGLVITGNAGATATLVAGEVEIVLPEYPFQLGGEELVGAARFRVGAGVFAEATAGVKAVVDMKGAALNADIQGFIGAKGFAEGQGTLHWAKKTNPEYAKRIVQAGILQSQLGDAIPDFAERYVEAQLREWVTKILDRVMVGSDPRPLVLGVTARGEAMVGVGGYASFSAGFRGGVLTAKGRAGFTLGAGAGYNVELELGVLDGMTMLAVMVLNHFAFDKDLVPSMNVWDFIKQEWIEKSKDEKDGDSGGIGSRIARGGAWIVDEIIGDDDEAPAAAQAPEVPQAAAQASQVPEAAEAPDTQVAATPPQKIAAKKAQSKKASGPPVMLGADAERAHARSQQGAGPSEAERVALDDLVTTLSKLPDDADAAKLEAATNEVRKRNAGVMKPAEAKPAKQPAKAQAKAKATAQAQPQAQEQESTAPVTSDRDTEFDEDGDAGGELPRIKKNVRLTGAIESAYRVLVPYLPSTVWMTSGLRSDEDQAALIHRYFARKNGPSSITDVEQRRQWLVARGMRIARVGSSNHRTGRAFDLSGTGLDSINAAVRKTAGAHPEFQLQKTIVERENNCLHVEVAGESAPAKTPAKKPAKSSGSTGDLTDEQASAVSDLGNIVARGESRGNYSAYNTGTIGGKVVHSGVKADLTQMTVNEILAASELPATDRDRVFAAGKYQIIPEALREAKQKMGLSGDEVFDKDLQERIFLEFLVGKKRPKIEGYIRHGEGTVEDALYSAAKEWASIEVPAGRRIAPRREGGTGRISDGTLSYYEDSTGKANHAHKGSGAKVKAALERAREAFAGISAGKIPAFERLPVEDIDAAPEPGHGRLY